MLSAPHSMSGTPPSDHAPLSGDDADRCRSCPINRCRQRLGLDYALTFFEYGLTLSGRAHRVSGIGRCRTRAWNIVGGPC